jgi:hypothetical protein
MRFPKATRGSAMAVTIFVWSMFKYQPGGSVGVGHASMFVHRPQGSIYISFWPAAHSLRAGLSSPGIVHFINGDKKADGQPDWASKPITTLDEGAIVRWWAQIQHNPLIDYKHKVHIQIEGSEPAAKGKTYSIVLNQCAITVVRGLIVGSDSATRARIIAWLVSNMGSTPLLVHVPTVTPLDVRELVEAIF